MKYKISIIIPVFNQEDYIVDALESIVKQTIGLEQLEVIMVNDCSTDKSGEIMNDYANEYRNFKFINLPENSGNAGKPRNVGIEKAKGKYLMFLDPDDFYADDICETLYNKIIKENVDLVLCNYNNYYPNGTFKKSWLRSFGDLDEIKVKNIDNNPRLLEIIRLWTAIYKSDFILDKGIKFREDILAEDRVFLLKTFLEANGIIYLQNYLGVNYRIRNPTGIKSLSNETSKKSVMDRVKGYIETFNILKNYKKEEYFPHILNVRDFWTERFIISNTSPSEKKEILEKIAFLFKEFEKYKIYVPPHRKNLIPLFNCITQGRYDDAILLNEILKDLKELELSEKYHSQFLNEQKETATLKKQNKSLKKQYIYLERLVKYYRSRKVVRFADMVLKSYHFLKSYLKKVITQKEDSKNIQVKNKVNSKHSNCEDNDFRSTIKPRSISTVVPKREPKKLKDFKIAVILDEFSYNSFKYEFNAIPVEPSNWLEIFEKEKPDIFLCESAWTGVDPERRSWFCKINYDITTKSENRGDLLDMIKYCNERGITTIFWNKEDPTNFDQFFDTALKFDHIFTSAEECVQRYKEEYGHKSVHCLLFAAQPKLFNPIEDVERSENIVFAGSWYNHFTQRCNEMMEIFDNILDSGFKLKIYDRAFYYKENANRLFPNRYHEFINPSVPHNQIDKVYKESKYSLNINTVTQSKTMFARRVFELMLSNTLVLSNYSEGMINLFGDNVVIVGKDKIDLSDSEKKRINNLYNVLRNHTYTERFKQILNVINYEYVHDDNAVTIYYVAYNECDIEDILEHYESIGYIYKKLVVILSDLIPNHKIKNIYQNHLNHKVSVYSLNNLLNQNSVISNDTPYFIFANLQLKKDFVEKAFLHYSYIESDVGISLGDEFTFKKVEDTENVLLFNDNFMNAFNNTYKDNSIKFSVYTIQI